MAEQLTLFAAGRRRYCVPLDDCDRCFGARHIERRGRMIPCAWCKERQP